MATIADVATRAGVSKSTASRALRGAGTVSVDTRRRVQAAANQLSFVATPSAARLATGRTHTLAVVTPYVNRWFFAQALAGIEQELEPAGFDLLLYHLHSVPVRQRFFQTLPLRRRVDGAVLLTTPVSDEEVEALTRIDLPVVFVGDAVPGTPSVHIDDREAARLATRHLLNLGHRTVAFIGGDPAEPMRFSAPWQRRFGFEDALKEADLTAWEDHVLSGDFTAAGAAAATAQLFGSRRSPSAVFAASDEMAFGVMHTLRRMGVRVPEDVSVVGFDDHDLAALYGLTTVRQDVVAQSRDAARTVLDVLATPAAAPQTPRAAPTELVVRESTALLRVPRRGPGPTAIRTTRIGEPKPRGITA